MPPVKEKKRICIEHRTQSADRCETRRPTLYPDLSNICCLIFHGVSYHIRFSRTRYSVTRRGAEASFGESRSPRFEYTSRVCRNSGSISKRGGEESEQTCMVSKRISAWITRRFPSLGPPRPRCPSIVRMLTIRGGVTSACSVHLNRWFGDVLDLSKPWRWLVYGFVVSFLIVLTSPLEGARRRSSSDSCVGDRNNAILVSLG